MQRCRCVRFHCGRFFDKLLWRRSIGTTGAKSRIEKKESFGGVEVGALSKRAAVSSAPAGGGRGESTIMNYTQLHSLPPARFRTPFS